ncbi:hypothetical protein P3T36_006590 [Kitasatospora sp. MAP12-15]|uniref:DUF317 domain-containing protein n=1 Tax=unclassified Kitasatospora TaxID=2633591 RepID=UPI002474E4A5|nr:DUF317 domain-containing protein [Kitasatospora sp. MAP12-44]MDH6115468.1 hypothetical protein [Kitasatospora sp. MAP12-44]
MPNTPDTPREYRVAPRYLANADADGSEAVQPLVDAGWALSQDDEGNTFVVSPDLRARVADFTTALADAYTHGPGAYLNRDDRTVGVETCLGLLAGKWSLNPATPFLTYQSPDRFVRLHVQDKPLRHDAEMASDTERWLFEAGPPGQFWYATASSRLPEHLLQALTTAVTNPAPVHRSMRRIDLADLPAVATATPTAPSPLEVARVRAATAHSTTSPSSRPPLEALHLSDLEGELLEKVFGVRAAALDHQLTGARRSRSTSGRRRYRSCEVSAEPLGELGVEPGQGGGG